MFKAQLQSDALKVQPVGCLWDCDLACVVAFSAANKPTYLFSAIASNCADALLEFGDRDVQSKTGIALRKRVRTLLEYQDSIS
ncbi:MAG: DUF1636 family protein [Leptolyngbyaceae cyanobacterium SU_3_3]|nr:DUF1636 family protein [Leptolyngbyaceae cyanobacterium SU_3_3]